MPLSIKRDDGFIDDWISAPLAASGELVCVAVGAIGTASLFHEPSTAKLLLASTADEVVSVPRHAKSLDHTVSDGVAASMAPRAVMFGEAGHAMDPVVVLVKLSSVDRLTASVADKVFGVPFLVQRRHDSALNHFVAAVTDGGGFNLC